MSLQIIFVGKTCIFVLPVVMRFTNCYKSLHSYSYYQVNTAAHTNSRNIDCYKINLVYLSLPVEWIVDESEHIRMNESFVCFWEICFYHIQNGKNYVNTKI